MKKGPVFLGVYSKIQLAGDGAERQRRWHAWSLESGQFLIQEIFSGKEKITEPQSISPDDFFNGYRVSTGFGAEDKAAVLKMPEPGNAPEKAAQPPETMAEAPKNATFYTVKKDAPPAPGAAAPETEPASELDKLEKQLRSDFSLALIRLRTGRDKALENLNKILDNNTRFDKKHKFMFSEFGTALRRRKLYSLAFRFHERARTLSPDDEHILFNMARAMFDAGNIDQARECLRQAVTMARDFRAGADFLEFIDGKGAFGADKHGKRI